MNVLLLILIAIGILLIGIVIGRKTMKSDGMFIVDDSGEETTKWILDVTIDPASIPSRKEIHLKVRKITEGDV